MRQRREPATARESACPLDQQLLESLVATIRSGRRLRRSLPGWGRIHIDRHLPYLCVYRRPPRRRDPGTARLLFGEPAYLLAPGESTCHDALRSLVADIAATQREHCGAFVLVEVWAEDMDAAAPVEAGAGAPPAFRLLAPRREAPVTTLEVLEQALLRIHMRGRPATVAVDYGGRCAPPGMRPLLTAAQQRALGCTLLGVAVAPVYRAPDGSLYPFALRLVHRGLSRALKQGVHEYLRPLGTRRPLHYLALGRRAMTRAVWEADRRLAEIGDRFDLLLHVTPVNSASAWRAFQRSRYRQPPEFHYRPRSVDPALLKRELYRIPLERVEDPTLSRMFENKRQELDRKLGLLGDRGRREFLYGSMQVFGVPDAGLLDAARHILARVPPHTRDDRRRLSLDADAFARAARRELSRYRRRLPDLPARVEVRDDVTGLVVSRGHLLVGRDARVAQRRMAASIHHEVGTHLVTYYNGLAQPLRLLHVGLAGYDETQEGLAVLAEYLVGGLSRPRLRTLAGRVLAVDALAAGADFIETFRLLHDVHGFGAQTAYTIAMRVHRGGGLTKDQVYLRGFRDLLAHLGSGGSFETLLLGKFSLRQVPWIEELRWREVLQGPALQPTYLAETEAQRRLETVRAGLTLERLVEEITAS
ncbi:MAG TPA: DUF1704 domain-containing protein [Gammaproteobacteria bacterium]|nr:DUF1704 domain-containing protein [Gammaproteobacteria bacterium]